MRQREKAQRFQLQEQQKENQVLQAQNHQYQLQIDRMTQIVQQLNKQGLPSPPDDGYLADALAGVLSDIRTWTRGANRHLPVFTAEAWNNVESDTQRLINSHFSNFEEIVASNDSKALRLKLLETLIYQRLSKVMLGKQVLGIDEHSNKAMTKLKDAIKSNKASDREMWWWFALSIHLLTKNSDQFEERQSDEVDNLTLDIHDRLMDVGISDRDSLKVQLRDIVLRAAQLGWEVARLPFRIQALSIPPGSKFNASCMEEVENPSDELEIKEAVVKAVMFPPIVKVAFDAEGKVVGNSDFQVLVKARVWCG
ncbi:hypothetical protein BDZ91DRAFT_544878 [Kalaharituber pfeilii]|nr:hypothetical protein BDZ91DRAFT_544878 [Kalaharituber pfeilii]